MMRIRSEIAEAKAVKRGTRSKGLHRKSLTTPTKLDNMIKRYDEKFELCKSFIVKIRKIQKSVHMHARWEIIRRERDIQRYHRLADDVDPQLYELYGARRAARNDRHYLENEPIPDDFEIAYADYMIENFTRKIKQFTKLKTQIDRNISNVKAKFTFMEKCLQVDKAALEYIHSKLCRRLTVIAHSRDRAIAQRKRLRRTKNGKKI